MIDKLKVTYDPKDGHKIITHTRPLSKKQQARAKYKELFTPDPDKEMKRRTNYWNRHKDFFNMPAVCFVVIVLLSALLIILSIIA